MGRTWPLGGMVEDKPRGGRGRGTGVVWEESIVGLDLDGDGDGDGKRAYVGMIVRGLDKRGRFSIL